MKKNFFLIAFWLLGSLVCIWLSASIWKESYQIIKTTYIPFDTDEADHANASLELALAIKSKNIKDIYQAIVRQSFYPPLHSVFVAPFYVFNEISIPSSRIFSLWALVLSVFIFTLTVIKINNLHIKNLYQLIFILGVSSILFTANKVFLENATLCMLEILGVLITLTVILLSTLKDTRLSSCLLAFCCFLLFITKYSFALMIVPGVWLAIMLTNRHTFLFSGVLFSLVLIWLSLIDFSSFKAFIIGHPSYAPIFSFKNLFFDLKSWFFEYHFNLFLSLTITVLVILGSLRAVLSFPLLVSLLASICGFFVLLLSSTNETRHFIVVVPCLWIIGVSFVTHNYHNSVATNFLKTILLLLVILTGYHFKPYVRQVIITGMEGQAYFNNLINFTVNNIDPLKPTLVLGNTDQISIEAIRWYGAKKSLQAYTKIRFDSYPFSTNKAENAKNRKRNVGQWYYDKNLAQDFPSVLENGYYKQVIMFRKIGVNDNTTKRIKEFCDYKPVNVLLRKTFYDHEAIVLKLN